ncbi:hypothetical protein GQ600_25892 [Phytophthora cactorum]|nr:hypothetical protein GQ600_25892 [Phytophthora cactorum]
MLLLPILPARTLLHTVGGVHSSLQWYRSAVEDESGTPCVWVRTAGRAEHGESWTTQGHIVLALPAEQVAHPIQAQTNNTTPNALNRETATGRPHGTGQYPVDAELRADAGNSAHAQRHPHARGADRGHDAQP